MTDSDIKQEENGQVSPLNSPAPQTSPKTPKKSPIKKRVKAENKTETPSKVGCRTSTFCSMILTTWAEAEDEGHPHLD